MTNRERVSAALNHRQPDKCPYNVQFTIPAAEKMAKYLGDADFESKLGNCFIVQTCHPKPDWQWLTPTIVRDHFGMVFDRTIDKDIGIITNRQVTPAKVEEFEFPDPANPTIWRAFEALVAAKGDQFIVASLGFSLFERSWGLAGMEQVLGGMVAEPRFVHRLMERILEYNMQVIERACQLDIDALLFGDDWGCQQGVMMGPKLWREFILPRARAMYQAAKARGKWVFIHSCGRIQELLPDLLEAGVDCFNPFQPEVMDVYEVKRQFGDRLNFLRRDQHPADTAVCHPRGDQSRSAATCR